MTDLDIATAKMKFDDLHSLLGKKIEIDDPDGYGVKGKLIKVNLTMEFIKTNLEAITQEGVCVTITPETVIKEVKKDEQ